jgi:phosphorylase kinase alpha/beta subunit
VKKLKGSYGFKRFIRDGYKTTLEDRTKRFYEKSEIKDFEKVECEWPLFYLYMIIDGVFKSLPDQISEYQDLLKHRIYLDQNGGESLKGIAFLQILTVNNKCQT